VIVPNPSGTYTAKVVGTDEGDYNLTVSKIENGKILESNSYKGPIIPGQTVEYKIAYHGPGIFGIPWLSLPILGILLALVLFVVFASLVIARRHGLLARKRNYPAR
jgi:hypothetical protein